jgi:hypothetical protein
MEFGVFLFFAAWVVIMTVSCCVKRQAPLLRNYTCLSSAWVQLCRIRLPLSHLDVLAACSCLWPSSCRRPRAS